MKATIRRIFTVTYQWMERGEPRTGHSVISAASADEARRKFRSNYPHVSVVGVSG